MSDRTSSRTKRLPQTPPATGAPPAPPRPPPAAPGPATSAPAPATRAAPPPPVEDVAAISRVLDRNHDLDFDKGRQFAQRQQFMEALKEYRKTTGSGDG